MYLPFSHCPINRPSANSRLKITYRFFVIVLLPCGTLFLMTYVSFLTIVILLRLTLACRSTVHTFLLSTPLLLKKLKLVFILIIFSVESVSSGLPLDRHFRFSPSICYFNRTQFAIIQLHFIHVNVLSLSANKLTLTCSTGISVMHHLHVILLFVFTFNTLSRFLMCFSLSSHIFMWRLEQRC